MNKFAKPLGWLFTILALVSASLAIFGQVYLNKDYARIEAMKQEIEENPRGLTGEEREYDISHKTELMESILEGVAADKPARNVTAGLAVGFAIAAAYFLKVSRRQEAVASQGDRAEDGDTRSSAR